jgi:hypothetical protein
MQGSRVDAIDHFSIPRSIRADLKVKVGSGYTDGLVAITKYGVYSEHYRFNDLMLMHFGKNKMCWGANRDSWSDTHVEYADLFCSSTYCVAIPHVCGNVTQLFGQQPWDTAPYSPNWGVAPHTVPEPSSLSLLLLPMLYLLWKTLVNKIHR